MPEIVDIHIGKRLCQRRWQIGITQKVLAEKTGVQFQQIQKYEAGINRVSASRLWDIAEVLEVPVSWFFEGLKPGTDGQDNAGPDADLLESRETVEFVTSWHGMPDVQRVLFLNLTKEMALRAQKGAP